VVPKKVVLERARDTRHYYYYCSRDTRLLLSSEKTLSTLDCGGFVVVEEFGREAAAAEVPGSISGACIQEPGLRSSVGRERETETETETENLREQEVICNYMLFGIGKARLQTNPPSVQRTQRETRRESGRGGSG
jgi:hypothetical protein